MIGETNINGGAGLNGKGALLKIKSQTGSTITVSKGSYSKTIKASQLDPDDNYWSYWFFQTTDFGEWTVIAELNSENVSKNVVINNASQYDVFLRQKFYIFKEGAGFLNNYTYSAYSNSATTGPFTSNEKFVWTVNNSGVGNQIQFLPAIDQSTWRKYNTLYFELKCTGRYSPSYAASFGVGPDKWLYENHPGTFDACTPTFYETTRTTIDLNISTVEGSIEYIKLASYAVCGEIYNIWLD